VDFSGGWGARVEVSLQGIGGGGVGKKEPEMVELPATTGGLPKSPGGKRTDGNKSNIIKGFRPKELSKMLVRRDAKNASVSTIGGRGDTEDPAKRGTRRNRSVTPHANRWMWEWVELKEKYARRKGFVQIVVEIGRGGVGERRAPTIGRPRELQPKFLGYSQE